MVVILLAAFAVTAAGLIVSWKRHGRAGWQSVWWAALTGAVAVSRVVLSVAHTVEVLVAIIVAASVASALMLASSVRNEARLRASGHPAVWLRLALSTLVIPVLWIPAAPAAVVMIIAAVELALLGVAAALAAAGAPVNDRVEVARYASLAAAGAIARGLPESAPALGWIAIAVMMAWLAHRTRQWLRPRAIFTS
jgi:hypothetical protein